MTHSAATPPAKPGTAPLPATLTSTIRSNQSSKPRRIWSAKRQIWIGLAALFLLVGGLGTWSMLANIAGAVISSGMVEVEESRQVVQHPDGGVVDDINVDDGDVVTVGDVLVSFDDRLERSQLTIIENQLFNVITRRARLEAERDGADGLRFDLDIDNSRIRDLMAGQIRLFNARRESVARETEQLNERIAQIEENIAGVRAQLDALTIQRDLIAKELSDQQQLFDKGLTKATRILSLRREEARLTGQVGNLMASIAGSKGRIAETNIEILRLTTRVREEAIEELRDLQNSETELRERRLAMLETLSRLDLRAPTSGIIYGSNVHTPQSVVGPGQTVMYVVPQRSPLVIVARVPTTDVDQVRVGQDATLAFAAFDARTTPQLFGSVTQVSADIFTDERTGEVYYRTEILPKTREMEKLEGYEILPGMPVEVFIRTDDRTPLAYLIKPMMDYFNKAFRES